MNTKKDEKDEYFDVDDGNSLGGDSGFSTGEDDKHEGAKKAKGEVNTKQDIQMPKQESNKKERKTVDQDTRKILQESDEIISLIDYQPETQVITESIVVEEEENNNFLYRIVSIPIIRDSCMGAQNIVRRNTVGQKALDFAETKLQPVLVSAYQTRLFSHANNLGNTSLDMLEKKFPIINTPTKDIIQPLKERIDGTLSLLKKSTEPVDHITIQFEKLLDYYIPADQEENVIEEHGIQRLLKVSHILTNRITKKVMTKVSAGKEEEERVRTMVKAWVSDKTKSLLEKQPAFIQDLIREKTTLSI